MGGKSKRINNSMGVGVGRKKASVRKKPGENRSKPDEETKKNKNLTQRKLKNNKNKNTKKRSASDPADGNSRKRKKMKRNGMLYRRSRKLFNFVIVTRRKIVDLLLYSTTLLV